jgi:hypothetical protein
LDLKMAAVNAFQTHNNQTQAPILFRGILFRILQDWRGNWIALLLSVIVFTLAHAPNEGVTYIALALVAAAGLLLSVASMLTRRLWLGIGIHIGWNFTQGGLFSAPVSGHPAKGMIQGALSGPNWLTGGAFKRLPYFFVSSSIRPGSS